MTSIGSGPRDYDEEPFDVYALLRRAMETVEMAKSMPLSASVIVPREEMLAILQACMDNLPSEVRQANWLLKERNEFLAKMEREGDEILRAARDRAERMVQRSELVRQAEQTAQKTVEQANDEARRLKHEAEDYCDQKLASFEVVLEKTWRTVQGGREKLRGPAVVDLNGSGAPASEVEGFFDQERR
jgi:cell division septum initiation protein DivIVA